MASVAAPYGFQPISGQSGIPNPVRMQNGIANQYTTNIYKGSAVKLVTATGTLQLVTNPGGIPDPIYGIFAGVYYTPLGGRPTVSPYWTAGTNVDTTQDFMVYIWPAWLPDTRWRVQADGPVGQALMGSQFLVTNPTAGNTTTGLSGQTVGAAGAGAGVQGQFALTEFFDNNGIYDTIGDAFTDLICTIALPQVGLGNQKSIG